MKNYDNYYYDFGTCTLLEVFNRGTDDFPKSSEEFIYVIDNLEGYLQESYYHDYSVIKRNKSHITFDTVNRHIHMYHDDSLICQVLMVDVCGYDLHGWASNYHRTVYMKAKDDTHKIDTTYLFDDLIVRSIRRAFIDFYSDREDMKGVYRSYVKYTLSSDTIDFLCPDKKCLGDEEYLIKIRGLLRSLCGFLELKDIKVAILCQGEYGEGDFLNEESR